MKRVDYQNPDDNLEEITDRSNAEVRAWGRKILADSDALLLSGQVRDDSDWDLLDDEDEIIIVPAIPEEPEEEPIAIESDKVAPKPRAKAKPA